jgi:hypothetical protein
MAIDQQGLALQYRQICDVISQLMQNIEGINERIVDSGLYSTIEGLASDDDPAGSTGFTKKEFLDMFYALSEMQAFFDGAPVEVAGGTDTPLLTHRIPINIIAVQQ